MDKTPRVREPLGNIITFYSYKGGTGRSMAVANIAWILASNGKRVLTVDWDLEAPGLHRYFAPFLSDKDLTGSEGLIDLLTQIDSATKMKDRLAAMLQVTRSKIIKRAEVLRKATGAEAITLANIEGPGS